MKLSVEQAADGKWAVVGDDGALIASGLSNSEAWKLVDRINGDPNTRREEVADWAFRKECRNESR